MLNLGLTTKYGIGNPVFIKYNIKLYLLHLAALKYFSLNKLKLVNVFKVVMVSYVPILSHVVCNHIIYK